MTSIHDMNIEERVAYFEQQQTAIRDALRILMGSGSGSTLDEAYYYLLETLRGAAKVAPYKKDDRVELVAAPEIDESSGWWFCRHFLVAGALATIKQVSLDSRGWSMYLEFDDESYVDYAGVVHPTPADRRHVFAFGPRLLKKVEP